MMFKSLTAAIVAVGLVGFTGISSAEAGGLFHSGCGACCTPNVVWGACAPSSCDPCGCNTGCGGCHKGGLLAKLFGGCKKSSCGCDAEPACGAPEPCGCDAPCEPACGAPAPCEPACGAPAPTCGCEATCEPACGAPAPCCKKKSCGGLLKKLFGGCKKSSCGCAEPACGAPAPCGCDAPCEPACGAPAPCGCS